MIVAGEEQEEHDNDSNAEGLVFQCEQDSLSHFKDGHCASVFVYLEFDLSKASQSIISRGQTICEHQGILGCARPSILSCESQGVFGWPGHPILFA